MAMEGDVTVMGKISDPKKMFGFESREAVTSAVNNYTDLYKTNDVNEVQKRKDQYSVMVNQFYNLVTEFYEFGWGQSFHFASRHKLESFEASIARHEMYVAHRLDLQKGKRALDLGCGIGGPMRTIARFSHADVTGVNNNDFQVERANKLSAELKMYPQCKAEKGDFMKMQFPNDTFDGAYHFEALCHAPDKKGVYTEILRVLKPGGLFCGMQWNVTGSYKPTDATHLKIVRGIEVGNGVAQLDTCQAELDAMKAAGFEIVEARDLAVESEIPWFAPLSAGMSISGFKHTKVGRWLTNKFVWLLEKVKLAPPGTLKVHTLLCQTADDLVDGGRLGIFTPMFFTLARKPMGK